LPDFSSIWVCISCLKEKDQAIMELQWRQKLLKERFDAINRSISAIRVTSQACAGTNITDLSTKQLKTLRCDLKHRIRHQSRSQDYENTSPFPSQRTPNPLIPRYIRHLEQANKQFRATVANLKAQRDALLETNQGLTAASAKDKARIAELQSRLKAEQEC
jgi:hypothetical protein